MIKIFFFIFSADVVKIMSYIKCISLSLIIRICFFSRYFQRYSLHLFIICILKLCFLCNAFLSLYLSLSLSLRNIGPTILGRRAYHNYSTPNKYGSSIDIKNMIYEQQNLFDFASCSIMDNNSYLLYQGMDQNKRIDKKNNFRVHLQRR